MAEETQIQAKYHKHRADTVPGRPSIGTAFLLVLAAVALYFCYLIAKPFLASVFLALMIAIVFHPIHLRIERRIQRRNLAGLTSTILVLVTVFVPTFILGVLATREAHVLYMQLSERSAEQGGWNPYTMHFVDHLSGWAGHYVDLSKLDIRGALVRSLEQISHSLFSWGTHFLSDIVSFFVEAIITFFTLFVLFREGESLKQESGDTICD
jgi:predicted PurR-regulated permease PerM